MTKFWNAPFPRTTSWVSLLYSALGFGLFVFLFLYFFKPFGLVHVEPLSYVTAYFGLITTVCMLLAYALRHFLSAEPEHWTAGKEILFTLFTILLIASANWLKTVHWGIATFDLAHWGMFLGYTLSIGVFPVVFGVFIREKRQRTVYANASRSLHPLQKQSDALILLKGEGQSESLSIHASKILFLQAADNYCEIYFDDGRQMQHRIFRSTLKQLEDQLTSFPEFLRVHRSYMVNTQRVDRISGNAQGFRLHLGTMEVPVSRGMNATIKAIFS